MSGALSTTGELHDVQGICGLLHRAYRDLRLYPSEHPMARQNLDVLVVALQDFVDTYGSLTLDVGEENLFFEEESVYSHSENRDNLAFLMFRDGMRAISFHQGIETVEIHDLVDCLAHADDLIHIDYDLVTALWERDFDHLDYQVADPFLGGEVIKEGMVDALRETVLRRLEEGQMPRGTGQAPDWDALKEVPVERIEGEAVALTPQEIERGEQAVERLEAVLDDFSEVLLEIAASSPIEDLDDVLARTFPPVIAAHLDSGDIGQASFLLERLQHMENHGWCPSGFVARVAGNAVSAEQLHGLMSGLGQSTAEDVQRLEKFLSRARDWIYDPLLQILCETEDRAIRKSILAILGTGGVPWTSLEPLLRDPRWYVVRNAVQLASSEHHAQLSEYWPRLLTHGDVRVRRETLRAMEQSGGRSAAAILVTALSDADSSVRTLAARALGRDGTSEHASSLLAQIEERNFADRPLEEVQAFLESYAELAQVQAVPILNRLWRKKRFSSRSIGFRLAAIRALVEINDPMAVSTLVEISKSADRQVKRAAAAALQMYSSREPGAVG